MDQLNVLVWGTAADGPCAYFRGYQYDDALAKLGVNMRHVSQVIFRAGGEFAHEHEEGSLPGCERCVEAVKAGKMEVDTSDLEWADVVVFRRYYNTTIACALPYAEATTTCFFRTFDMIEAQQHEHPVKYQDDITRHIWPAIRDGWEGAIVYETDDNHWQIKPWNGYYGDVIRERDLIADMTRRADLVTVATPALAKEYGRYNDRIRVVRNAIDPDLYVKDAPHPGGDKPRLVYYGSTARMRDYAGKYVGYADAPGYAMRAVQDNRHLLHRVFLGTNPGTEHVISRFFDEQHPYIDGTNGGIAGFSKALANSHGDIGIAPLGQDDFDVCKSELHWLEYAMTDMAFIGQRFRGDGPYQVVRDGVDGLLARGAQEWFDAVRRLATSKTLRDDLAGAAKERILAEYQFKDRAVEWADAFRWAAEHAGIGKRRTLVAA